MEYQEHIPPNRGQGNYVVLTREEYKKILDRVVHSVSTGDCAIYSVHDSSWKYECDAETGTTTWDTVWKDALTEKKVDLLDGSMNLSLEKGEYYIYFPFEFLQEGEPAVVQSVVRMEYGSAGKEKNYYVSQPFTYFEDRWKSDSFLKEIFKKAMTRKDV